MCPAQHFEPERFQILLWMPISLLSSLPWILEDGERDGKRQMKVTFFLNWENCYAILSGHKAVRQIIKLETNVNPRQRYSNIFLLYLLKEFWEKLSALLHLNLNALHQQFIIDILYSIKDSGMLLIGSCFKHAIKPIDTTNSPVLVVSTLHSNFTLSFLKLAIMQPYISAI